MKVAVFGHRGMLGDEVVRALIDSGNEASVYSGRLVDKLHIQHAVDGSDVVINCCGKIPQRCTNNLEMIHSNSIIPHLLAENFKGRILHISTDKVFSGMNIGRNYSVSDVPSPTSLYGRSKLVGEVKAPNVTNIRTSFIGQKHGLLNWLVSNDGGTVQGYKNAIWSGSYAYEVAYRLVKLLDNSNLRNVEHLCTREPISKYDLLVYLVEKLGLNIRVVSEVETIQNFALWSTYTINSVKELDSVYSYA